MDCYGCGKHDIRQLECTRVWICFNVADFEAVCSEALGAAGYDRLAQWPHALVAHDVCVEVEDFLSGAFALVELDAVAGLGDVGECRYFSYGD